MDFSAFNQIDWVIAAVMTLSGLLGLWRGVVREIVSVAGWIAAVILVFRYAAELAPHLTFFTAFGDIGRVAAAAAVIAFATVAAFAVAGAVLRLLIKAVSGGLGDSLLGLLFGFARGFLIVALGVFAASFTSAPEGLSWQRSELLPYVEKGLSLMRPLMPEALVQMEELAQRRQRAFRAAWEAKFKL
ncbi:CvpA family protein [Mesosutterella sp. OilRF-GAM-744-9]|uniref:CvpA family protein n=1 Tax=Mesosutterella porci TaxID=2915351 RepID=A0ABS9MPC9_9BURK|nr:CvpA family protein [Mesosutterella sp. oilRF-744-WT-GAM-9]MCG5030392.1 CvpA family protein [Mesosutterella sp. oilRF-744-WT-GAM-9]MCI6529507.1 CvpA family protein [Mesosutterella sp.]